jgi:periplasmic divalent cation tolerance protein
MPQPSAILVVTTAGSHDEAASIAASVVDARLAACVQIVPGVESVYRWEGRVATDTEWLLLCKTTADRYDALQDAIVRMHSYTTPEVVALSIDRGSPAYLEWLVESVT